MLTGRPTHEPYTERWPAAASAIGLVTMPDVPAIVFVVDDDVSVRDSLELLIRTAGWAAPHMPPPTGFSRPPPPPAVPSCLVLDVTLPGLSGLELQARLAERTDMPIIF